MSTSPRLAPETTAPAAVEPAPSTQPFPYTSISAARGNRRLEATSLEAEAASREMQARNLGRQEGQAAAQRAFEEQLVGERKALADAITHFAGERAAYFQKVEGEVVQLALSIARKILHREAQLDRLLLAGIVRVALEKIDGATEVRLRLHPQNAAAWRTYFSTHLDAKNTPQLVEDAAQPLDGCVLETAMGVSEIGVESQLKEVEQGLMDLLALRPGGSS